MATGQIGKLYEFDKKQEEWTQYIERLEHFFDANGHNTAAKKKSILLAALGPTGYKRVRSLISPAKPGDKTYNELVEVMKSHYSPTPSETVERHKFNSRCRKKGETVAEYVAALRSLAEFCNFEDSLSKMLRDRLVIGVQDTHIQRCLLAEKNLTFDTAFDLAQSMELADAGATTIQDCKKEPSSRGEDDAEVHTMRRKKFSDRRRKPEGSQREASSICSRCGKPGHSAGTCRFKTAKCYACGKIGHIKPACRSSKKGGHPRQKSTPTSPGNVQLVEDDSDAGEEEEYDLFQVPSSTKLKPYFITLKVSGQQLKMEIDTGAALSLISETLQQELWPNKRLLPTTAVLRTYSGEVLPAKGRLLVNVSYGGQNYSLSLVVLRGQGSTLFGRDWLQQIPLDWKEIYQVNMGPLESVLDKHQVVFQDELGTMKDYAAKIVVDPTVPPRFCRPRQVPYAIKGLVDAKLDKMIKDGVIYSLTVIQSHCHTVSLSYCLTVIQSHCQLSHCHTVSLTYCLTIIQSHCHTVSLSYCLTIIQSHCHTVSLTVISLTVLLSCSLTSVMYSVM